MQNNDITKLSSAPAAEIKSKAEYCNLTAKGAKGIYWARKSVFCELTDKEYSIKFSTKTADLRTAVMVAYPRIEQFKLAKVNPALAPADGSKLTLAELEQHYLAAPTVGASPKTRKENFAELYRVVRLVLGEAFDAEKAPVKIISKVLAKTYQQKRLTLATAQFAKESNLLDLEASKRAINAALSHAQAVFSERAREDYEPLGLPATVLEFAMASKMKTAKPPRVVNLTDATVQQMMNGAVEQKRLDLGMWQAFQLMLWGGLRNSEVFAVRAGWFTKLPSGDYRLQLEITEDFQPKGNYTSRVMPGAVVEELLATVVVPEGVELADAYVVSGTSKTDRHQAIYRRLGRWLKTQGVETQCDKVAYRLRKYFFQKVRDQQGLRLAAIAHGGDAATVAKHYVDDTQMAAPIKFSAAAGQ